jgi:predicted permease
MRRAPGFTAIVVVTMALGIGATAAIYSVVDWLFVQPPAGVTSPDQVRHLYLRTARTFDKLPLLQSGFWFPHFVALRDAMKGRAELVAYTAPESVSVGYGDHGELLETTYTTGTYFTTLGVQPARGRFFAPDEDRVESPALVAVLSDHLWRRAFDGRRDIIGQTIVLDQRPFTIIGVAPAGFTGIDIESADLWLPLSTYPLAPYSGTPWYQTTPPLFVQGAVKVLARASAGTSDDAIASIGTSVLQHLDRDSTAAVFVGPINEAKGPTLRGPISAAPVQALPQTNVSIRITGRLMAAVALLLAISCANVGNLLLGRALRRRRETAIRLALGTSRSQLIGQLATEAALLALIAAGVATVLAGWGGDVLRAILLPGTHVVRGVYDLNVALLTIAVTLLVAVFAAVVPATQATRPDLRRTLTSTATSVGTRSGRIRESLIVVQAALSVIMLIGAGVFLRSLLHLRAVDTGYDATRLIGARVSFKDPVGRYDESAAHQQDIGLGLEDVVRRLDGNPIIEHVAISLSFPMTGILVGPLRVPGRDTLPTLATQSGSPPFLQVSPEYFATAGQHVVAGRTFTDADRPVGTFNDEAYRAAVVNETMARTLWPGEQAVGKCIIVVGPPPKDACTPVVGVVSDAKIHNVIEPPMMTYYLPLQQHRGRMIIARAAGGHEALAEQLLAQTLRERFPSAEPARVRSLADLIEPQLRPWRLGTILFSGCGVLALAITLIGVYGVVSYAVTQRTAEMGIRMALGAPEWAVHWLVTSYGLRAVGLGVLAGSVLSVILGGAIESLLYDTSPADPFVMVGVGALLCVCAAIASAGPALRAARTSLVDTLRAD